MDACRAKARGEKGECRMQNAECRVQNAELKLMFIEQLCYLKGERSPSLPQRGRGTAEAVDEESISVVHKG